MSIIFFFCNILEMKSKRQQEQNDRNLIKKNVQNEEMKNYYKLENQESTSTQKLTIKYDHVDILMQTDKIEKNYQKNIRYQMNNSQKDQLYKIIPQLAISPSGQFKYILIKCRVNGQDIATFVRGDLKFQYHAENFEEFKKELKKYGFTQLKLKSQKIYAVRGEQKYQFVCPGGGRIEHNYQGQLCSIYGYSQSYGHVNHEQAQNIISTHLGYPIQQIKLNEKDY